jgi:hypothetical protein
VIFAPVRGGASLTAVTDDSGAYSINLPEGVYQLTLGGPRRGLPYDGPTRVTVIGVSSIEADFVYQNLAV